MNDDDTDFGPDFGRRLLADMTRLGERRYSEAGVPMFLLAEDLRGGPPAALDAAGPELAETFAAMTRTFEAHRPEFTLGDTARLVEVLADRHLLGDGAPDFTRLSDGPGGPQ